MQRIIQYEHCMRNTIISNLFQAYFFFVVRLDGVRGRMRVEEFRGDIRFESTICGDSLILNHNSINPHRKQLDFHNLVYYIRWLAMHFVQTNRSNWLHNQALIKYDGKLHGAMDFIDSPSSKQCSARRKKNIVAFHLIDVIEMQWRNKCPSNQKFIEFNHS